MTLLSDVRGMVQDPGILDAEILAKLNEGLLAITAAIKQPELDSMATVTTELAANIIDLPTDYHHGLYAARHLKRSLTVYDSRAAMLRVFPDTSIAGAVYGLSTKGSELMYLPIPNVATDLDIFYFSKPTPLTEDSVPDCFTARAQVYGEAALKHYAAKELWSDIEDGVEGQKVNTLFHEAKYMAMLEKVEQYTDGISNAPPPIVRCSW